MRATLNQLEAFCWISRLGGFHAAAARLNLTQPTITQRIRGLEASLGLRLFERSGRRVRLTADGQQLLPRVEQMLALSGELHAGAVKRDPIKGRLRFGAPDSFGLACVPRLLASLKRRYPELSVALTIDNSSVLSQRLNDRDLDFAILADPHLGPNVAKELLGTMECAWVASTGLALPDRPIHPIDLLGFEIFTNPAPSNLMTALRDWFAIDGLEPSRLSTCNNLSVILRLTIEGAGVSLLPVPILPPNIRASSLRILQAQPELGRPRIFGAYQIDRAGPTIGAVMETAREVILHSNWSKKSFRSQ